MGGPPYAEPAGMTSPAVIADAYDRYADQLYAYCRFLLGDPSDAADALEETFLVVAARLAALPPRTDPRPWLFAVARNECLRSARSRRVMPVPADDETAYGQQDGAPLRAAVGGLPAGERDLIGMLWHGLEIDDIAAVLGIGREDAFSRLSLALSHLETATTALLVARAGSLECPGLAAVLGDWSGRLNVPLTRKLTRHIERCRACSARRQGELRPALLLSLTPGALLGAAVTAEALRPVTGTVAVLRDQILSLACDPSAAGGEARERACRRSDPFGTLPVQRDGPRPGGAPGHGDPVSPAIGFPRPLRADAGGALSTPRARIVAGTAAVAAVAIAATVGVVGGPGRTRVADDGVAGATGRPASAVVVTGSPSASFASASPAPSSASPSPSPSASPSASPSPTPSARPSRSAAPPSSPKPAPTIQVPSSVTLRWKNGQWEWQGTLPVTVSGGTISWSIANPNQRLQLSQSSGTASASVRITGHFHDSPQPLTVTAGSASYTVTLVTSD